MSYVLKYFLSPVSMLMQERDIVRQSHPSVCLRVCLSICLCVYVCPSVCLSHSGIVSKHIVKLVHAMAMTLVFFVPKAVIKFKGEPLSEEEALNTRAGKILRFSTEIPVYLGNGTI